MDTIVGLIRNGACVLNALLPTNHILKQQAFTHIFAFITTRNEAYSNELLKTTYLGYIIAVTQFLAVLFNLSSGFRNLFEGVSHFFIYSFYIDLLESIADTELALALTKSPLPRAPSGLLEYVILKRSLQADRLKAIHTVLMGCVGVVFGVGFLVLTANSLKYFTTNAKPVIDAIMAQEFALFYVLCVMISEIREKRKRSAVFEKLAAKVESLKKTKVHFSEALTACAYVGYGDSLMDAVALICPHSSCAKKLKEVDFPTYRNITSMEDIVGAIAKNNSPIKVDLQTLSVLLVTAVEEKCDKKEKDKEGDKEEVTTTTTTKSITIDTKSLVASLQAESKTQYGESVFDIIYFVLNFAAFCGYFISCLVFYFPGTSSFPLLKSMDVPYSDDDVDFYGNMTGDAAWVIEPMLILLSPFVLGFYCLEKKGGNVEVASSNSKGEGGGGAVKETKKEKKNK